MHFITFATVGVALLPSVGAASASAAQCKDVVFTLTASALNLDLSTVNTADLNAVIAAIRADDFSLISVTGTEEIAGTFCEPLTKNANSTKLQVLFSSITGNRDHFSALGGTSLGYTSYQPQMYSWVDYAHALGALKMAGDFFDFVSFLTESADATLAIDRLGTGRSSHPDPVLKCQAPYEVALYHQLVASVRAGATDQLPAYDQLLFLGHSYGSQLGSKMAHEYPDDFDAILLTGFSKNVLPSLPGISLQVPVPAALHDPTRFGTLDPGYLTTSIKTARTNSFFGTHTDVDFDDEIATLFYEREDVVSIGQFVSVYTIATTYAPEYNKRVLVLTGEEDQAFCGLGSAALGPAKCGTLLADSASLFPSANYSYFSVPRTGHILFFHESVPLVLKVGNDFLGGANFGQ